MPGGPLGTGVLAAGRRGRHSGPGRGSRLLLLARGRYGQPVRTVSVACRAQAFPQGAVRNTLNKA